MTNGQVLIRELYLDQGIIPPGHISAPPEWVEEAVREWSYDMLEAFAAAGDDNELRNRLCLSHPQLHEWLDEKFMELFG